VAVHRATLADHEIRERQGIPVTAPIRTIMDLAARCTDSELEAAVAESFALRLTNRGAILRSLVPGRRGARRLRRLLDAGPKRTRSSPERALLTALRAAGIEEPDVNARLGRWEVDFYWPRHRLVVEIDGYAAHSSPAAFERDRRKDAELAEVGVSVRRFTAKQVRDDPDGVVARIAREARMGAAN
jgi:very-short-patch-repair endonuclease